MSLKTNTGMSIAGHDQAIGFDAGNGLGEMSRRMTRSNGVLNDNNEMPAEFWRSSYGYASGGYTSLSGQRLGVAFNTDISESDNDFYFTNLEDEAAARRAKAPHNG